MIDSYLKEKYKDYYNQWGDHLFGVFIIGKAIYGFAETAADLECVACYIPDFDDLCFTNPKFDGEISDVRMIYPKFIKQDLRVLESTFSPYYKVNPKYEKYYNEKVKINRERLFHHNKKERLLNAITRGLNHLEDGDYFEAVRILTASNMYINGCSIENCLCITDFVFKTYLNNIISGDVIPNKEDLIDEFAALKEKVEKIDSDIDEGSQNIVKEFVKELIKDVNLPKELPQIDEFNKATTAMEKEALGYIKKEIEEEGTISIVKIVEESKISRPVYRSLLDKMTKYKIAEVSNMGVKGTYICFLDNE